MIKDKLTVDEMRDLLTKDGAYTTEEISGLKKGELRKMVETLNNVEDLLSQAEMTLDSNIVVANVDEDKDVDTEEDVETKVKPSDKGWTDYIISEFSDDELDKGSPKVDGLRRVAELVYGRFNIRTDIIDSPNINNAGRASVVVRLEFLTGEHKGWLVDGAADVFSGNTDRKFAKHAIATAETRAEGRALRKALKLTKVVSAEETYNSDDDEPTGSDGRITHSMVSSLNIMANRAEIDALKTALKMGYDIQSLDELQQKQGVKLADQIGKYQRGEEEIPDEIRS